PPLAHPAPTSWNFELSAQFAPHVVSSASDPVKDGICMATWTSPTLVPIGEPAMNTEFVRLTTRIEFWPPPAVNAPLPRSNSPLPSASAAAVAARTTRQAMIAVILVRKDKHPIMRPRRVALAIQARVAERLRPCIGAWRCYRADRRGRRGVGCGGVVPSS